MNRNDTHLDTFLLKNRQRTLLWLIAVYFLNIMLAFFITMANKNMVVPSSYYISQSVRAVNLLLLLTSFLWVYKRRFGVAQVSVMLAVILSLAMALQNPPAQGIIAVVSFTVSLTIYLFVINALFMNSWFTFGAVIFNFLIFNVYFALINTHPKVTELITDAYANALLITINVLLLIVSLFVITTTFGTNRLSHYISDLVYIDLRTGLYNERQFDYMIQQMIKKKDFFILLCIDFKNLLHLNRQHGYRIVHQQFMTQIETLRKIMLPFGVPYKLEGPMFGFIIKTEHLSLMEIEKTLQDLVHHLKLKGLETNANITLEHQWLATQYPQDGETSHELMDNLYHLKYLTQPGTATIRWYDHGAFEQAKRVITLESDLQTAIQNQHIDIVLQPQLNMITGKLRGAEVLARWFHPEYGIISPLEFIPMVERLGLMTPFTEAVIHKTHALRKKSQSLNLSLPPVSINFTAASFSDGSIFHLIKGTDDVFEIEITESTLMDLNDHAHVVLSQLKQRGFTIAIDDFGTGFSNLEYLHSLDVDYLKIDKRFVDSMMTNEKALKLVEALIGMAHTLNISVIAEGVETKMQVDVLKELKCDHLQGYWYSKPLNGDDFIAFISN